MPKLKPVDDAVGSVRVPAGFAAELPKENPVLAAGAAPKLNPVAVVAAAGVPPKEKPVAMVKRNNQLNYISIWNRKARGWLGTYFKINDLAIHVIEIGNSSVIMTFNQFANKLNIL